MKKLFALIAAVFSFAFAQVVWAQPTISTAGWVQLSSANGDGVFMGPGYFNQARASVGQAVWNSATGGGATVSTTQKLAVAAGEAKVIASGAATGAAVFSVFKTILGGPLSVGLTVLTVAPAVIDWLTAGGARVASTPGVTTQFERQDPTVCSVAPCNEYSVGWRTDGGAEVWFSTMAQACSWVIGKHFTGDSAGFLVVTSAASGTNCVGTMTGGYGMSVSAHTRTVTPSPVNWLPSSIDDIRAQMEKTPSTAPLINELLNRGGSLPIAYAPGGVSGPASVVAPPVVKAVVIPALPSTLATETKTGNPYGIASNTATVTKTVTGSRDVSIDGKTVSIPTTATTTSTYNPNTNQTTDSTVTTSDPHTLTNTTNKTTNLSYSTAAAPDGSSAAVPKVTTTTTSTGTSVLVNNITNNTVSTTNITENKPESPDIATDTPFNPVPKLYERKYPDGLVGVWNTQKAAVLATPLLALTSSMIPSIAAPGGYPSFPVHVLIGPWDYGTYDVSPSPNVWDFLKMCVIVSALFLCRALIFGG